MRKAINTSELKELIKVNPGISGKLLRKHFKCRSTKLNRALRKLRDKDALFVQMKSNEGFYFDSAYAEDNEIPERIMVEGKGQSWYRKRAQRIAAEEKREGKKKNPFELELYLNTLWPVMRSSR